MGFHSVARKSAPCFLGTRSDTIQTSRVGSIATFSFSPPGTAACFFTHGCTSAGTICRCPKSNGSGKLHSKTPGHPEFGDTPGVECTTGPLGQGVGNAVGMSVATKMAAARFNTDEHKIFDQHVVCLCGDGDLQEGVASEACALAGVWGLDNLIFIYDSNAVTLDAPAKLTQSEDTGQRIQGVRL